MDEMHSSISCRPLIHSSQEHLNPQMTNAQHLLLDSPAGWSVARRREVAGSNSVEIVHLQASLRKKTAEVALLIMRIIVSLRGFFYFAFVIRLDGLCWLNPSLYWRRIARRATNVCQVRPDG